MGIIIRKAFFLATVLQIVYCISGCSSRARGETSRDLGTTIGSLVEVAYPESIAVEGYGLVGGLRGTGSMECPPQIRSYLTQYIIAQLPADTVSKADSLIDSTDTAVVHVEAVIPIQESKSQYFDVRVAALPGTQTTSLKGGWLYRCELKIAGSFGIATEILADVEGPVFVDQISAGVDKRKGYILAGGKNLTEQDIIVLILEKPDFKMANVIRNRLNERFGRDIARAVSSGRIELKIPSNYKEDRKRFISMVRAMYLEDTPEVILKRINYYTEKLARKPKKEENEIALEAIGNRCLVELAGLLRESDEHVRLRAARCILKVGSNASLPTLTQIALDKDSAYRLEALEAMTSSVRTDEAASVARRLLNDDDFDISLAAYEQLRKIDDVSITREAIDRSFYLEQIVRSEQKVVFAFRSGQPRIVLFGAPIYCNRGIFVKSPDGQITIDAPADSWKVTIIRTHPTRPSVIARMESSFDLSDIIRKLCMEPEVKGDKSRGGLGVSYADMIALLQQMCDKGAINAEFRVGPMPKIGFNVKK